MTREARLAGWIGIGILAGIVLALLTVVTITRTQWVGKIGGVQNPKETQTNALDFDHVTVDLAEPVSFSYIVVNNGNTDQTKILAALASGSDSLSLASSASLAEQVAKGVVKWVSLKIVGLLAIDVPVIGSALKKIETWLLGKLTDTLFKSCDGLVAVEVRAIMGRDLYMQSGNGTKTLKGSTRHPGSTSPANCGAASDYEVFWTIKPQP